MGLPIAVPIAMAAGQAALGAGQLLSAGKREAAPKFQIPKSYEERMGRLKTRSAMAGELPGQARMEQEQGRISASGIEAMRGSADYTTNIAKYLQQERDAMANIGIKAAERRDQLDADVLSAMKDKEGYEMEKFRDEQDRWRMKEEERLGKQAAGMQNISGALSQGASIATTYGGDETGSGSYGKSGYADTMTRRQWKNMGKPQYNEPQ
jgi:hypothetical protein